MTQTTLTQAAEKMAVALVEARDQLWLLAKDPRNNPWINECNEALEQWDKANGRKPETTPDDMPPVVKFLLGEGELDGCWFGQTQPVGAIGPYWWRKYLREAWRNRCQSQ